MPKSCVAPECRSEGARESYYKFPLHDKVRLKQWLSKMNMENFFPSKNQYLCGKHFKPSCFQVRLGVRYLKNDAVPTVFSSSGLPNKAHSAKSRALSSAQSVSNEFCRSSVSNMGIDEARPLSEALTFTLDPTFAAGQMSINGTEMLVTDPNALALPTTVMGAVNLVPLVHIVESFDGLSLALAPAQGFPSVGLPIVVAKQQQPHQLPLVQPITILSEEHIASTALQQGFYDNQVLQSAGAGDPTFIQVNDVSNNGALVMENISIEPFFEAGLPTPEPVTMSSEDVISYLETMQTATVGPTLAAGPLPPLPSSLETVLSTSITRPIPSTVPIVSEHRKEVVTSDVTKRICLNPTREPDGLSETLTNADLVSVVVNLQEKVKALQQRHKKHCSKLEVMEGMVEQLKNENLISEENLNEMEVACLNSTSAASEDGDTIAIVCEEDSQPLVYTFPFPADNRNVFHITEQ
ncbi:PREDICTED: THAP domain-containing protein 5-like [Nanorana parkeri]|uniref:THAP domain-containing protein 5-like n=1 Tax=Nanorana parkeri TaxID=125878 RepID=UPI0008550777|nr:PREDICTED: THAP domain-containing protein 5-like [Nanorana parkeri]